MIWMLGGIADPSATEVAAVIGAIVFLIAGWNQVQSLLDRQKDKPAPGDVRAEAVERFVLKSDCAARHLVDKTEHDNIFSKLGGVERGALARTERLDHEWQARMEKQLSDIRAERKADIGELHTKVNKVDRELGEVNSALKLTTAQLVRMDQKLDKMAEK